MRSWLQWSLTGIYLLCYTKAGADMNPKQAFEAGKAFGQAGKDQAYSFINDQAGAKNVPYFGKKAEEGDLFQEGEGNLANGIAKKRALCQPGSLASNAVAQQECDALNFVVRNPSERLPSPVDPENDPLVKRSKKIIEDSSSEIPGSGSQQCRVEVIQKPAKFSEETCNQSLHLENKQCEQILLIKRIAGCKPGKYLGGFIKKTCESCIDPYIHGAVYCAHADGYEISIWTSTQPNGPVYAQYFLKRPVPGKIGFSQGKTLIGDVGQGCRSPFYYSQNCDDQFCQMNLSRQGSTCTGNDFSVSNPYPIPFTYQDEWEDQCGGFSTIKR